jgi:hypothetical protein
MNTLGGFIVIRNGDLLDYSWREAAQSLLPHVQELVICDCDSTDGTTQEIQRWADLEPKIRYANFPWTDPKGVSHNWWIDALNFGRQQLTTTHFVYVDSDEYLSDHPDCITALQEALADGKPRLMDRLNFWRDAQSLIPEGEVCGRKVSRFGPVAYEAVSDEPRHAGERPILDEAIFDERLVVFHLGFLREQKAFYRKARAVLDIWFRRYDERLAKTEEEGRPVWESECAFTDRLVPWQGYMPLPVQHWLAARGHWTKDLVPLLPSPEIQPIAAPVTPQIGWNYTSSGDLGDLIYSLAIVKQIPGRHAVLLREDGGGYGQCRTRGMLGQEDVFAKLALSQSYIQEVRRIQPGDSVNWQSEQFRLAFTRGSNLVGALAATDGVPKNKPYGVKPWLTVKPMPGVADRIICNRTRRWCGEHFPWRAIADFYREKILFVGTKEEHEDFCHDNGDVEHFETPDALVIARLIAGAALFIGNQSACMAIAIGLGKPFIQEVCLSQPDCIYPQEGAQYCYDGSCTMTNFQTGEKRYLPPHRRGTISTHTTPPGGWQYRVDPLPKPLISPTFMGVLQLCDWNGLGDKNDPALAQRVRDYNGSRPECAAFFFGTMNASLYSRVYQALRQAGYQI